MSRTKDFLISISEKYGFGGHLTDEVIEIARAEWENLSSVGRDQALLREGFFDTPGEDTKNETEIDS